MSNEKREAALGYAGRGIPVFPVHYLRGDGVCSCGGPGVNPRCKPGKHPITPAGHKGAMADAEIVAAWWTRHPDANIGTPTGRGTRLLVLDADGERGRRALADLGYPEDAPRVRTGSGGMHVHLSYPEGEEVRNSASKLAPGLDVRGEGGYVLLPPSRNAGGPYVWEVERNGHLPECPSWLPILLAKGGKDGEGPKERFDTAAALAGLPEGERDDAIWRLACKLRNADVPRDMAEKLVAEAASNCTPPFDPAAAREKVERAYRTYEPRSSPSSSPSTRDGRDDGTAAALPPLRSVRLRDVTPPKGPREYLVAGLLPAKYPAMVYGDGGVAKSMLALSMGTAVARGGGEWLGRKVEGGPVLYLDFELDEEEQVRRARRLALGENPSDPEPPEDLRYMSALGYPPGAAFDCALEECAEHGVRLLVVDSLGVALQGDAEAARDVIGFHNRHLAPFRAGGVTVFIIDHQSKMQAGEKYQAKRAFGSVYKGNLARSVIQAERVGGGEGTLLVRLRQNKHNFGPLAEPFGAKLTFNEAWVRVDPEDLSASELAAEEMLNSTDRVRLALRDGPAFPDEIAEATGLARKTVKNAVTKLKKGGGVEETGEAKGLSRQVRIVPPGSSPSSLAPRDEDEDDRGYDFFAVRPAESPRSNVFDPSDPRR